MRKTTTPGVAIGCAKRRARERVEVNRGDEIGEVAEPAGGVFGPLNLGVDAFAAGIPEESP